MRFVRITCLPFTTYIQRCFALIRPIPTRKVNAVKTGLRARPQCGFTLLELIVVVFIIGVTLSFAVISVNQSSDEHIEEAAQRLHQLVRLASEEAVFKGREMALLISSDSYSFAIIADGKLVPLEGDKLLKATKFPEDARIIVELGEEKVNFNEREKPVEIYILSSGEITPFVIRFTQLDEAQFENDQIYYTVSASLTGKVSYIPPGENRDDYLDS